MLSGDGIDIVILMSKPYDASVPSKFYEMIDKITNPVEKEMIYLTSIFADVPQISFNSVRYFSKRFDIDMTKIPKLLPQDLICKFCEFIPNLIKVKQSYRCILTNLTRAFNYNNDICLLKKLFQFKNTYLIHEYLKFAKSNISVDDLIKYLFDMDNETIYIYGGIPAWYYHDYVRKIISIIPDNKACIVLTSVFMNPCDTLMSSDEYLQEFSLLFYSKLSTDSTVYHAYVTYLSKFLDLDIDEDFGSDDFAKRVLMTVSQKADLTKRAFTECIDNLPLYALECIIKSNGHAISFINELLKNRKSCSIFLEKAEKSKGLLKKIYDIISCVSFCTTNIDDKDFRKFCDGLKNISELLFPFNVCVQLCKMFFDTDLQNAALAIVRGKNFEEFKALSLIFDHMLQVTKNFGNDSYAIVALVAMFCSGLNKEDSLMLLSDFMEDCNLSKITVVDSMPEDLAEFFSSKRSKNEVEKFIKSKINCKDMYSLDRTTIDMQIENYDFVLNQQNQGFSIFGFFKRSPKRTVVRSSSLRSMQIDKSRSLGSLLSDRNSTNDNSAKGGTPTNTGVSLSTYSLLNSLSPLGGHGMFGQRRFSSVDLLKGVEYSKGGNVSDSELVDSHKRSSVSPPQMFPSFSIISSSNDEYDSD